jgi:hypothetical protein
MDPAGGVLALLLGGAGRFDSGSLLRQSPREVVLAMALR